MRIFSASKSDTRWTSTKIDIKNIKTHIIVKTTKYICCSSQNLRFLNTYYITNIIFLKTTLYFTLKNTSVLIIIRIFKHVFSFMTYVQQ